MTDLERAVVYTLRLSDGAATRLLPMIQMHIQTARAELIRSGVSATVANGNSNLVNDCIIAFVMARMGEESERSFYGDAFFNQQENLRKS